MSRSYRTQKESRVASRRIARDTEGEPALPRIVERRPAKGDEHPIPAHALRHLLARVPIAYPYGLRAIELRARSAPVGQPFGQYRPSERSIILYSVPSVWELSPLPAEFRRSFKRFHATIQDSPGGTTTRVTWRGWEVRAGWFYTEVLAHELGHHFRYQYRRKNGTWGRRQEEEAVAILHAARFRNRLFAGIRAKAAAKRAPVTSRAV